MFLNYKEKKEYHLFYPNELKKCLVKILFNVLIFLKKCNIWSILAFAKAILLIVEFELGKTKISYEKWMTFFMDLQTKFSMHACVLVLKVNSIRQIM